MQVVLHSNRLADVMDGHLLETGVMAMRSKSKFLFDGRVTEYYECSRAGIPRKGDYSTRRAKHMVRREIAFYLRHVDSGSAW